MFHTLLPVCCFVVVAGTPLALQTCPNLDGFNQLHGIFNMSALEEERLLDPTEGSDSEELVDGSRSAVEELGDYDNDKNIDHNDDDNDDGEDDKGRSFCGGKKMAKMALDMMKCLSLSPRSKTFKPNPWLL